MHLKLDSSGAIDDGDVARDLGQDTADIVVLSAADSELAAFGAAAAGLGPGFPSVTLTNLLALGHPGVGRRLCRAHALRRQNRRLAHAGRRKLLAPRRRKPAHRCLAPRRAVRLRSRRADLESGAGRARYARRRGDRTAVALLQRRRCRECRAGVALRRAT